MKLQRFVCVFLGSALGSSSPVASALADPATGIAVGPRIERGEAGIGLEAWTERLGVAVTVNGTAWESEDKWSVSFADGDEYRMKTRSDSFDVGVSTGLFVVLGSSDRARASLGLRARVERWAADYGPGTDDVSRTSLGLEVPLRVQYMLTERIGVQTDVGVGVSRINHRTAYEDDNARSESGWTDWRLEEFVTPWANFGVSYFF